MNNNDYVIINNRAYDPITGLPVEGVVPEPIQPAAPTRQRIERGVEMPKLHRTPQQSATLSRRHVKKPRVILPLDQQASAEPIVAAYSPMSLQQLTVEKAKPVQKFPAAPAVAPAPAKADRPAEAHPVTYRAANRSLDITAPQRKRNAAARQMTARTEMTHQAAPQQTADKQLKSAHALKNEAIYEAMNREVAPQKQKRTRAKKQRSSGRWARFMTFGSASLAVVMLAGYLTYLNMPNLSIRMAAVQSGVDATYPGYRPDGYALNGPVSFKDGEVSMRFAYAGGDQDFIITQKKSGWDSSAVRQFVDTQASSAVTTQVDGITIYTYNGNAAWVNGGIFYTLEGNAPLSNSQIQRIATSM